MNKAERVIKRAFRAVGLEIRRYVPEPSPTAQLMASFRQFGIDLVLDVGASTGQFASEIRGAGYAGDIVSFEPLSRDHRALQHASVADPRWTVHERCALGDREGEASIHIARNSVSSSLLPMLDAHLSAAPASAYIGSEAVPLRTLDSIAPAYLAAGRRPFLKIDTQGFEGKVLDGARKVLPAIRGALLELSLVPLYAGQPLWQELIDRMQREGFFLWGLQPGFTHPQTGRTLQVDGIFFREQPASPGP